MFALWILLSNCDESELPSSRNALPAVSRMSAMDQKVPYALR